MPSPNELIRHIRYASSIKAGKVLRKAFKVDEDGISTTICGGEINTPTDIETYLDAVSVRSGIQRLGLCFVKVEQVEDLELSVTEDKHQIHEYGDLHRLVQDKTQPDLRPNDDHRDQLALAATQNGGFIRPDETPTIVEEAEDSTGS